MIRLVAGIDEAGRGPLIGPLVIAGLLVREEQIQNLVDLGARDSKRLTPKRRAELVPLIESTATDFLYVEISPEEIDDRVNKGITLNQIEAERIVFMINRLHPDKIYIDCPDVNPNRFTQWLRNGVRLEKVEIVAMHHADESIPVVSAASIMAKVRRDKRLKELADRLGDIGSGYPSDQTTRLYVERTLKHLDRTSQIPAFLRSTWRTIKRINMPDDGDKTAT